MTFFFFATILLFVATAIFYIVFTALMFYWHEKKASFVILPFLFTFEFFMIGFLLISLLSILFTYFPEALKLIPSL